MLGTPDTNKNVLIEEKPYTFRLLTLRKTSIRYLREYYKSSMKTLGVVPEWINIIAVDEKTRGSRLHNSRNSGYAII